MAISEPLFPEWIAELERLMAALVARYGHNAVPYTLPLKESTGLDCWYDMFDDCMTPQHALEEDALNWEE